MRLLATRFTQRLIDIGILSASYWLAYLTRFEGDLPFQVFKQALFAWPYVVVFQYSVLVASGVPHFAWRYIGLRETTRVFSAIGIASAILLGVRIVCGYLTPSFPYLRYALLPIGVIAADFLISFLGIAGVRVLRRLQTERNATARRRMDNTPQLTPTMLIGAGQAGLMVAKELMARPDLGIQPVGFLDDDGTKHGLTLHGVRVLGSTTRVAEFCRQRGAEQVLVTIANAPSSTIRRIVMNCEESGLPTKIIPGLYEIVGGGVSIVRIRPVAIADLLGRAPVDLDLQTISAFIQGKSVLVTGAGGSIGSEIARQVLRFAPRELLLVERAENALFEVSRVLSSDVVNPIIGDVTDSNKVAQIFAHYRPDVVFHAAAHKHVPMMEHNPAEAVKNNVLGTMTVADAAAKFGTERFVLISTDKAVNPSSVMGATKRVAELYIQSMSTREGQTDFVAVRFGNVLGSNGSVVPIFKEQIATGGPVTVTHPEMRRYFMTIPEAAQLVLQAATLGRAGEVMVLDMGEPVRIADLAEDLIRLSGLEPGRDVEIEFTGVRPGEKLFEELATSDEAATRTEHRKVFIAKVATTDPQELSCGIDALASAAQTGSESAIRAALLALVPEFRGGASDENLIELRRERASAGP